MVIERVLPELDGGRHPVKRVAGDEILVSADIYKDGHDLLAARVRFRPEGEAPWQTSPLSYDFDSDRWSGSFVADTVGRWIYTVEAWTDEFGTWRSALEKKLAASQDVASDLLAGAALVGDASKRARGAERQRLRDVAERIASTAASIESQP